MLGSYKPLNGPHEAIIFNRYIPTKLN